MATAAPATAQAGQAAQTTPDYSVGPQYDTTHVYVPQQQYDAFMQSFVATFGGKLSPQGQFQVTPTPSKTKSQLALTPAGTVSGFGFLTPIPYPFGHERTGYLVSDMDAAVAAARKHGAVRLITTFPDPIGRDVVVQWPGGVNMQFYWHTSKPSYPALQTVPENRVYLTSDAASAFLKSWSGYAHAKVLDDRTRDGADIGEPGKTYRRVLLRSGYGDMHVIVSDGQVPWPYGHELTGYTVANLAQTLEKAKAAGVETLVAAHTAGDRQSAMVRFPGGYIAEIHAPVKP
nr:glyoxalase [Novosphingobium sp. Leaf2]